MISTQKIFNPKIHFMSGGDFLFEGKVKLVL